ncbi:MAG: hypothetical protein NTX01_07120 [Candidatus Omnitrophica bacterium]|nr:hypothetical protein [Candidatus Omnitrophota bacterium]
MNKVLLKFFCIALLILFPVALSWAQNWEKQEDFYFLTKNNRDNFSLVGAGPNNFDSKYLKYEEVNFLVRGASDWKDYGRLDLEGNNMFFLPIRSGMKVDALHLLAGGNYSNSYEHDGLMRLYGDKYFYATLTVIFVYQDGVYQELCVPVFWDWFHIGSGAWSKNGARIKSLGDNPVRKDCNMFHISFANPRPSEPLKNILIMDSWLDDRPFSDVFAVTLKSQDTLEAEPKKEKL